MKAKTKGQLQKEYNLMKGRYDAMYKRLLKLEGILRNYKTHMKAITTKINYLLKHPYSEYKGMRGRKK